jgi:hypothetical protein
MTASAIATHFETSKDAELSSAARRVLIFGIGLQIAMLITSLAAYMLDERLVNAINVWSKPLKFQLSISLNMLTMLLLLPLLSVAWLSSRTIRWSATAVAFASTFEIAYIVLQASRGRASHFNTLTPVEGVMYQLMGIGSVILVLGPFIVGLAIWRSPAADNLGLRFGAILGLTIGAALTLFTAGYLSSSIILESGRWVGGAKNDASGLPLLGWSTTGGDLRVSHFFATHTMQVLPLVGLAADRFMQNKGRLLVWIAALVCISIVAVTFVQARSGMPVLGL